MEADSNDIVYNSYSLDFTPLFRSIYEFFSGNDVSAANFNELLQSIWTIYSVIAFVLSFLFIFGIIYSYLKINEYGAMQAKDLEAKEKAWQALYGQRSESGADSQWSRIEQKVATENPSEWKLAIIEADILLGQALTNAGYRGTIGEQLKSVPETQLAGLRDAWDAHMIRNKIAHEGADYVLTQGAAREAIVKFARVLRELGAI